MKMKYKKTCLVCEEIYTTNAFSRLYCSRGCSAQANEWNLNKQFIDTNTRLSNKYKNTIHDLSIKKIKIYKKERRPNIYCGIYFLFENEILVYIGATDNIIRRVAQHANNKGGTKSTIDKKWTHFMFYEYNKERNERQDLELYLIRKLKPKYQKDNGQV